METLEINGSKYEVIGHDKDGVPTIRGIATSTNEGLDKDGNPKVSVNISVPPITIGATPGEVA